MADSDKPAEGDTYACKECGMAILVTTECKCDTDDGPFFSCCGKQLEKGSGGG